jgi:hypothetical protein
MCLTHSFGFCGSIPGLVGFSLGPIYTLVELFFLSSEINQLEIINHSVLRMFIIALQLCFVYEPYEGLRKFQ